MMYFLAIAPFAGFIVAWLWLTRPKRVVSPKLCKHTHIIIVARFPMEGGPATREVVCTDCQTRLDGEKKDD